MSVQVVEFLCCLCLQCVFQIQAFFPQHSPAQRQPLRAATQAGFSQRSLLHGAKHALA
jgi:hypothetical protein